MKDNIILALLILLGSCTSSFDEIEIEVQPPHTLSDAEEMNVWIYNQMRHYYLWNEELPDSDDCDFNLIPTEFFESILSSKDRFSHMQNRTSRSADLGFAYQAYKTTTGEIIYQVQYITNRQAKELGLKRGDFVRIKSQNISEVSLDIIQLNESNSCIKNISYELNSDDYNNTVLMDSVYHIGERNIGYLCYLEYGEPSDLYESFKLFKRKQINELILDLRYNPGGYVNTCRKLCSLIVPAKAYGKIFQQNSYNNIIAAENKETYGDERTYSYFESPIDDSQPTLGAKYDFLSLDKIYVLTSSHTASASESTICCLSPYMNVITIGATTVGKGVGMQTISSSRFKYSLLPITFRYYNSDGETVPDTGIVPDYIVDDSYLYPKSRIGDIDEPLFAKAIELITGIKSSSIINSRSSNLDNSLTPVGEPSYVTEFKNRHYNESN